MTAWEMRGLPKTNRWADHLFVSTDFAQHRWQPYLRHSSTMARELLMLAQHMTHRSCCGCQLPEKRERKEPTLKFDRMTSKPPFSGPSIFSSGTSTLSKVMYAVPAAVEYDVLICLVETFSVRGTRKTVSPPSVYEIQLWDLRTLR